MHVIAASGVEPDSFEQARRWRPTRRRLLAASLFLAVLGCAATSSFARPESASACTYSDGGYIVNGAAHNVWYWDYGSSPHGYHNWTWGETVNDSGYSVRLQLGVKGSNGAQDLYVSSNNIGPGGYFYYSHFSEFSKNWPVVGGIGQQGITNNTIYGSFCS